MEKEPDTDRVQFGIRMRVTYLEARGILEGGDRRARPGERGG
jgi:hypothetical protein